MKNIYEIFEEFNNAETRQDRIEVLRKNRLINKRLVVVLQAAFHPDVKFVFKKPLQYKKSDAPPGLGYTSIEMETRKLYLFLENSNRVDPNLTQERKEVLAIQILEALEAKEAEVFMNMLMKDLKVKGLTYKLVNEAFPNLLP